MTCYRYALYAFQLIELFKEQRSFFLSCKWKISFQCSIKYGQKFRETTEYDLSNIQAAKKFRKICICMFEAQLFNNMPYIDLRILFFFFSVHRYMYFSFFFLKFDLPKSNLNWHTYMVWQKRILFKSFVSI